MTVTASSRYTLLSPSAGATTLDYSFPLMAQADLVVIRTRAGVDAILTLDTDYSFEGGLGTDSGGTVTLASATSEDDTFVLLGLAALVRGSDFVPTLKFDTDKYNADLDRLTRADQEARRDIDRAVKVRFGAAEQALPTPSAGKIIAWDGDGKLANQEVGILPENIIGVAGKDDTPADKSKVVPTVERVDNERGMPASDDGTALGTSAKRWSDLFLATAGVINWGGGNVTITQSNGALTFGGSSGFSTMLVSGPAGSAGHALPQIVLRSNDDVTPDGAGGFIRFQGLTSDGTMKSSAQVNAGFVDATDGAENATFAINVYRDGDATTPAVGINAVYEAWIPGTDNYWDLGATSPDNRRWRSLYLVQKAKIDNSGGPGAVDISGSSSAILSLTDGDSASGKRSARLRMDSNQLVIDSLTDALAVVSTHTRFYHGGGLGVGTPIGGDPGAGNVNLAGEMRINGSKVVGARAIGWAAATGTASRTTFDAATVTAADLAQRVKALIDDLISHGLIGA